MADSRPHSNVIRSCIERAVISFCETARRHPGLGSVFAAHVSDQRANEAKVAAQQCRQAESA